MIDNKGLSQAVKDALNDLFGVKTEVDMETKIAKENATIVHKSGETETKTIDIENAWVWVEGYKGTDKDMHCLSQQYELGIVYQMPREDVDECRAGYHLCLNMKDVQNYYPIGAGNRYFKVRALVRLKDRNEYGEYPEIAYSGYYSPAYARRRKDKLAAAEIEFLEELTIDEILKDTIAENWDECYKKMVIESGLNAAKGVMQLDTLMSYGYSLPFAQYLINTKKYDVAKAVGSQPDLSMDMKVLYIMQG